MLVRCPERHIGHERRCEQVRIDPPNAFAVQLVRPNEGSDLRVTDSRNSMDEVVRFQKLASPTGISDQQLAVYQIVSGGLVSLK